MSILRMGETRSNKLLSAMRGKTGGCAMDDLISRKAAIKAVENLQNCYNGFSDIYDKACIIGVLEEVPSAQKHGKWEKISDRNYKCSCCNAWWSVDRNSTMKDFKYCPNCGSNMERNEE